MTRNNNNNNNINNGIDHDHGNGNGNNDGHGHGNDNGNNNINGHTICFFLGASRRNNSQYSTEINFAIGQLVYVGHFSSLEEAIEILQRHDYIRALIASINQSYENGMITIEQRINRMRNEWLPQIYSLKNELGDEFVPVDIRSAATDVEANIGMDITSWEPLAVGVMLFE